MVPGMEALKNTKIAVVGLGYVGLPLALAFAREFPDVTGFDVNRAKVAELESGVDRTREAAEAGAHLVAFPEMVLTGYPAEDLVLRRSFVQASLDALEALAARLADEGAGDVAV